MTVHQPPAGARDLLPLDVAQKQWIEGRLQDAFQRWGYHRIITSTLERLDTLMAGGAIDRSTVIQFQDPDDEMLGLRPELTASIARAAVTRMSELTLPQRLYYNANVFRRNGESHHGRQQEFYQAGVELLGARGVMADAEVLLLLADSLQGLGLQRWTLVLGEAELTRALLDPFPESIRDRVRHAIARLDRVALETMALSPQLRDRALGLFELRGRPKDVLQKLASFDLDDDRRRVLDNLKSLVALVETIDRDLLDRIVLDLSIIETFNYYTGIVFEVVCECESGTRLLGKGGRYDRLLELYDPQKQPCPGIGFSLNLEDLQQTLLASDRLPKDIPAIDWLVVPTNTRSQMAAFTYAQQLRRETASVRVELELGDAEDRNAVLERARHRCVARVVWVAEDGTPQIEALDDAKM
ncbi:MAG: ATP phosphoribosyltransferase regulatory subunit [Cyanobacteria bacterium SID2]|nr:ATP phosphoribosyltransferase regulatory subunit [Cyanobacteria bacterium SID2]MBP0002829.1 ATP phosphoribosyltransferase regulatory subunit [Cyanobacteria bacterium SBC]